MHQLEQQQQVRRHNSSWNFQFVPLVFLLFCLFAEEAAVVQAKASSTGNKTMRFVVSVTGQLGAMCQYVKVWEFTPLIIDLTLKQKIWWPESAVLKTVVHKFMGLYCRHWRVIFLPVATAAHIKAVCCSCSMRRALSTEQRLRWFYKEEILSSTWECHSWLHLCPKRRLSNTTQTNSGQNVSNLTSQVNIDIYWKISLQI